ncbi:MAG: uracil-DNA glycosylase family protein [Bacteroidaceae bacterium]|nr:uracil-DNA glycosylase family protein [Bacteroidaceae bacterium]MBQ9175866.1 uracil-DNA glycosylase family protein [Bacteroidaceae bacterium]
MRLENTPATTSAPVVEHHPLQPFLPVATRVLFLGSFPPGQHRWCMPFFYPNYINDHWRIIGSIFFGDSLHFVDTSARTFRLDLIRPFLERTGIGYFDTMQAVRRLRGGASDKYLEMVTPTDIPTLIRPLSQLQIIAVTGNLAASTLVNTLGMDHVPAVGEYVEYTPSATQHPRPHPLLVYRLPSSSRAYPLSLDRKVEAYRRMFQLAQLID